MAKRKRCRHTCLADHDLDQLFRAIGECPIVDPIDFFGPERLEEIAECSWCTSVVLGVYDFVVRVATPEEMLAELAGIAFDHRERDGKKMAERMAELSFV